jgi:phosphoenolpyruvate carboxylase
MDTAQLTQQQKQEFNTVLQSLPFDQYTSFTDAIKKAAIETLPLKKSVPPSPKYRTKARHRGHYSQIQTMLKKFKLSKQEQQDIHHIIEKLELADPILDHPDFSTFELTQTYLNALKKEYIHKMKKISKTKAKEFNMKRKNFFIQRQKKEINSLFERT